MHLHWHYPTSLRVATSLSLSLSLPDPLEFRSDSVWRPKLLAAPTIDGNNIVRLPQCLTVIYPQLTVRRSLCARQSVCVRNVLFDRRSNQKTRIDSPESHGLNHNHLSTALSSICRGTLSTFLSVCSHVDHAKLDASLEPAQRHVFFVRPHPSFARSFVLFSRSSHLASCASCYDQQ